MSILYVTCLANTRICICIYFLILFNAIFQFQQISLIFHFISFSIFRKVLTVNIIPSGFLVNLCFIFFWPHLSLKKLPVKFVFMSAVIVEGEPWRNWWNYCRVSRRSRVRLSAHSQSGSLVHWAAALLQCVISYKNETRTWWFIYYIILTDMFKRSSLTKNSQLYDNVFNKTSYLFPECKNSKWLNLCFQLFPKNVKFNNRKQSRWESHIHISKCEKRIYQSRPIFT